MGPGRCKQSTSTVTAVAAHLASLDPALRPLDEVMSIADPGESDDQIATVEEDQGGDDAWASNVLSPNAARSPQAPLPGMVSGTPVAKRVAGSTGNGHGGTRNMGGSSPAVMALQDVTNSNGRFSLHPHIDASAKGGARTPGTTLPLFSSGMISSFRLPLGGGGGSVHHSPVASKATKRRLLQATTTPRARLPGGGTPMVAAVQV
jgi:hypothetical protein